MTVRHFHNPITGLMLAALILCCMTIVTACGRKSEQATAPSHRPTFTNPIESGSGYHISFHDGYYYAVQGKSDHITIRRTDDITRLAESPPAIAWRSSDAGTATSIIWDPHLHLIDGRWYIYFSMGRDSDRRRIHVLRCTGDNPAEDPFRLAARIVTDPDDNLAYQPHLFSHNGKLYMIWSGWAHERVFEETQRIYIAEMDGPLRLRSPRVEISSPNREWECQWVGIDGNRSAYPIYVNEAPHFHTSLDGRKMLIYYSASAMWTPWHCVGRLTADADSDPLDPASWTKSDDPVFKQAPENEVYSPANVNFIPSPDSTEWFITYQARTSLLDMFVTDNRTLRMQPVTSLRHI